MQKRTKKKKIQRQKEKDDRMAFSKIGKENQTLKKKKKDRPIQYMFNLFTGSTKPLCSYVRAIIKKIKIKLMPISDAEQCHETKYRS